MRESLAQLWAGIQAGTSATDHIVAILVMVAFGFGAGALLLYNEAKNRRPQ